MSERKTLFIALAQVAYEGDTIIGVFDSKSRADTAVKMHNDKNNQRGDYEYDIDEVIMNTYDRDF